MIVDDCPKHLAPDPSTATHSIYILDHNLRIPLLVKGVISYIPTHYPSATELESCQWVDLTSSEEWDPHSESFAEEEGQVQQRIDSIPVHPDRNIVLVMSFSQAINNRVMASANTTSRSSDSQRNKIASTFGIGLETAQRTLKATT